MNKLIFVSLLIILQKNLAVKQIISKKISIISFKNTLDISNTDNI